MRGKTLSEISERLKAPLSSDVQAAGYKIDSRRVEPGDLFFALKGARVDGHQFLEEVASKGGVGAVVEEGYLGPSFGLVLVRVPDVLEALQELGRQAGRERSAYLIGVTGSVGKTTTKEWIAALLSKTFRVAKSESSYNSQCTFPLTLLNFQGDEDVWVLEMGMNEPGGIRRLVEVAEPDLAVITKIAHAHIAEFADGIEGIAREKSAIFSKERTRRVCVDHQFLQFQAADSLPKERITFSLESREADYFLSEEGWVDERGIRAANLDLPFRERHLRHDLLAAIAVARQLGVTWEEMERRLPELSLLQHRFQRFEWEGIVFIDDVYNANPASVEAALRNLPTPHTGGKRIAVLGMMAELGPLSDLFHAEIGKVARENVDLLLTWGEATEPMCRAFAESGKPVERFQSHDALSAKLFELAKPGDVVLVKGSRMSEMERVLEGYAALAR